MRLTVAEVKCCSKRDSHESCDHVCKRQLRMSSSWVVSWEEADRECVTRGKRS